MSSSQNRRLPPAESFVSRAHGGGPWVKGAKAGWKAGRRLGALPHKDSLPHRSGSSEADHRHRAAGVASKTACSTGRTVSQAMRHASRGSDWEEERAVGKGHPGRLGSRPPARLPVWHARLRAPRERPAWQAWRLAPREATAWHAPQRPEGRFFERERGRRPAPPHAPGWYGGKIRAGKPATSETVCGAARDAST